MSNEELICTFMEPNPPAPEQAYQQSPIGWWVCRFSVMGQRLIWLTGDKVYSLDGLHEVEAKLSAEQQGRYLDVLVPDAMAKVGWIWRSVHASAEQKIQALAEVLRGEVEK